ncbi:hypothetical protein T265_06358 [Opisthorchis viverrini]|uniref:Uncharacterized protein n=1 Tax=Opisthorchis viverrini TaxID=6198 RepID=A0A075ADY3_OPIVI|nr:hypothetical protein T265_06358 [Opisthorchis viverrini]KER26374.1 hypothetical protein T265_06358 [Opisthorchis viverrini]
MLQSFFVIQSGPVDVEAPFRCLASIPPEESTRAEILPGCSSLDRESRKAGVGFEPRTFRLGQPGSIPVLMLPSGGMAARHRKGATAEHYT